MNYIKEWNLSSQKRRQLTRNSESDLARLLGRDRQLQILVLTWNLNSSLNINMTKLRQFICNRKCDIYIFGSQEMATHANATHKWEVILQQCLGKKYLLLHAVRFGSLHLAVFLDRKIEKFCSTVDWGVLSVRIFSEFCLSSSLVYIFG